MSFFKNYLIALLAVVLVVTASHYVIPQFSTYYAQCRENHGPNTCVDMWWNH